MSRVGKKPIPIPSGVTITVTANNEVVVKGPKGELRQQIDRDLKVEVKDDTLEVTRPTDMKRHMAMHGLYRALVANMVEGVTNGYKRTLELVGVGYRAAVAGQEIDLALGYSHNIIFQIPTEVKATAEAEKGKNPKIHLESNDKQLLGAVAAKIRSLRKPEPYKGKGVRYSDEIVRRKAGKAAGK